MQRAAGPQTILTATERAEVKRLVETTGWMDARDYLRGRGYSLAHANDIVLPQGRGGRLRRPISAAVRRGTIGIMGVRRVRGCWPP